MTTKHTCGGPIFGKKTTGCPRCDEMLAGAPAVKWNKVSNNMQRVREIRAHNCAVSKCGVVCTFGDW